jgi:protein-L-isoaspartate(D-aspartate) O-methyltransferase
MGALTEEEAFQRRRRLRMVEEQLVGITDPRVVRALREVPRHRFVPPDQVEHAYEDRPLGIGSGQTISQPYMVALMTQALDLCAGERVLEVGTGSGYQTAVLCALGARVCTIERIPRLAEEARRRLEGAPVCWHVGDGSTGLASEAPFDAILVAAASPSLPISLVAQLRAEGGRMVIPVGEGKVQDLVRVRRGGGRVVRQKLCRCAFVRLLGKEGWQESCAEAI